MADPREFMLSIGAKLVEGDITKIIDQITVAFKNVPILEIREVGLAQLKRDMDNGLAVTKQLIQYEKELEKEYNALEKSVTSFAASLQKSSKDEVKAVTDSLKANEQAAAGISRAWRTSMNESASSMIVLVNALEALNAAESKATSKPQPRQPLNSINPLFQSFSHEAEIANRLAQQKQLSEAADERKAGSALSSQFTNDSQTSQIADMVAQNTAAQEAHRAFREAVTSTDGAIKSQDLTMEKAAATFERYTPALLRGVEAHRQMNLALPAGIANVRGFADEFTHMIGQFALWSAGAHLIEGGVGAITKGLSDAVHSEKEQNITGQYYQAQGQTYTPAMSTEAQQSAIDMARIYGEEVIHVQESVGLWGKVTKGELVPALALTNEAMKLNAVSGMNMEEIYRDSVAVMGQMQEPLSRVSDLYNIATGLALRYGGGIQTLGGQSDDAVKQMMDGMTRLSSVMVVGLGKGHDTLARIGAEVAVVSHLTNTSGDEVAGHLAAAFAGIEGNGKVIQGLKSIGIEAKNNQNLIEEMGAQMGKVVPIIMGAGVRKQDEEDVLTLLRNYQLVTKATNDARKAMADAALDKSFESMMKTTEQQLKELKAGWEAVGITVGKEFIPFMQGAADVGNNEVVPWLLANKSAVVDLAKELVTLGIAFGTFSIVKTVVAVAIRALNEFEIAAGKVAIAESLSSKVMMMDLTAYQRKCLDTLAVTGEADEEMVSSVKLFAAQHNLSIDSVILKMNELKIASAQTAGTFATDQELMSAAATDTDIKMGVATGAMEAKFAGLAVAGESMSVRIGTAFLRMIPVLGIALTAFEVGKFALDQLSQHQNDNPNDRYHGTRMAHSSASRDDHFAAVLQDRKDLANAPRRTRQDLMHLSGLRSKLAGDEKAFGDEDSYESRDQTASNPLTAARTAQDLTVKATRDRLNAIYAAGQLANTRNFINEGSGGDNYETAATSPKGIASTATQEGLAAKDISANYDKFIGQIQDKIKLTDADIASEEKRITIYGDTNKIVKELIASLTVKNALDNAEVGVLASKRGAIQGEINKATKELPKDHTSTAYTSQKSRIDSMEGTIKSLNDQIAALKANMVVNGGKIGEVNDQYTNETLRSQYTGGFKNIKDDFGSAKLTLTGAKTPESSTAAYSAYTTAVETANAAINKMENTILATSSAKDGLSKQALEDIASLEEYRKTVNAAIPGLEAYAALKLKLSDSQLDANIKDPALLTALKGLSAAQNEYNHNLVISHAAGEDNSVADAYRNQQVAIASAAFALSEYNEKKKQVEASPAFAEITAEIDTFGNALQKAMEGPVNYFKNQMSVIVQTSNDRIRQLQSEDSALTGSQYLGVKNSDMLSIRTQQQNAQAAQYKIDNPTLLTTLSTTLTKSFSTSITSGLETMAKSGALASLTGQNDPTKLAQNQFQTSVAAFALAVKQMGLGSGGNTFHASSSGGSPGSGDDSLNALDMDAMTQNSNATAAGSAATGLNTVATTAATTAQNTLNTTMKSVSSAFAAGIAGAGTGGGIASLFGGNALGGSIGGGLGGVLGNMITIAGKTNPLIGLGASALGGIIGGLFGGPKMNATNNPDSVEPSTYAQFVTNLQGGHYNGTSLDAGISAQTGGVGEGQYIENFIKGKTPAQLASVFGSEAPSIQQMFGRFTEGGGVTNLSNGNLSISGEQVNWQTIQTQATDAFTAITSAANAMNQALAPIVSISAYGKGSNSATFSPYYTPGYGDTSSLSAIPYPSLFATNPTTATYNGAPATGTGNLTTTITLDGQVIAQNTSQYRSQQVSRGFQPDS